MATFVAVVDTGSCHMNGCCDLKPDGTGIHTARPFRSVTGHAESDSPLHVSPDQELKGSHSICDVIQKQLVSTDKGQEQAGQRRIDIEAWTGLLAAIDESG